MAWGITHRHFGLLTLKDGPLIWTYHCHDFWYLYLHVTLAFIRYTHFSFVEYSTDIEYWEESDTELDEDFTTQRPMTSPVLPDANEDTELLDDEQNAIVYWVTLFTCVLQVLHSLPLCAVQWLIAFLSTILTCLGKYSTKIAQIAKAFPKTLHLRNIYIRSLITMPSVQIMVVCRKCHATYNLRDCSQREEHNFVPCTVQNVLNHLHC